MLDHFCYENCIYPDSANAFCPKSNVSAIARGIIYSIKRLHHKIDTENLEFTKN
jgi:hypothetical protein